MTSQPNLCEMCESYVLGGLRPDEQDAFERHLLTCESCQTARMEYEEVAGWLLYDFPDVEPNEGMKARILTHVLGDEDTLQARTVQAVASPGEEPLVRQFSTAKRRRIGSAWLSGAMGAVIAASVVVAVFVTVSPHHPAASPFGNVLSEQALSSVSGNGTAKFLLTSDDGKRDLFLQFGKLKPTLGKQVYQVWFINQSGEPVSAGMFQVSKTGPSVFSAPVPAGDYQTIAVTLEPNAGNTVPKGTKQFVGTF